MLSDSVRDAPGITVPAPCTAVSGAAGVLSQLTVASWNVLADAYALPSRYPGTDRALLEPGTRTGLIVATVAALFASGADVACLQEAEAPLASALEEAFGAERVSFVPKANPGQPDGCVTVLSPSSAWCRSARGASAFPDGTGHVCQWTLLTMSAHRVVVANSHLRWSEGAVAGSVTYCQANWLAKAASDAATAAGPGAAAVICGDLNAGPDTPAVAALRRSGWRDGHPPQLTTAVISGRRLRLDYILARDATVEGRLSPALPADAPCLAMPSDHRPVVATVSL